VVVLRWRGIYPFQIGRAGRVPNSVCAVDIVSRLSPLAHLLCCCLAFFVPFDHGICKKFIGDST